MRADDSIRKNFLQQKHIVTLTNVGNTNAGNSYEIQMSTLDRIFTTSKPVAETSNLQVGQQLSWDYELAQGETTTITYLISYIPILEIALSIVLLFYIVAWYYRQDVGIVKEIESHGNSLKVKLTARGSSRNMLKSVILEDYVPTPLKLQDNFGSVHPTAVKKESGKVRVVWRIDNLYPGDEKVFTYTMKSSLGLIGDVLLPAAKAKALVGGESKVFYSNRVAMKGKIDVSEIEEEKPES